MKFTCCPSCGSNFASWSAPSKPISKQPLVLKCGHTFCETCVVQRAKKITSQLHQAQVACPTCKNITLMENGTKDLPVNVYLSAYIEINQRNKLDQQLGLGLGHFVPASRLPRTLSKIETTKESKCKMCVARNATSKCAECDNMLCIACFEKIHSMSAAIKHHKPIPVCLIQPTASNEAEPKCADHDRILEYFCEDDSSSICSRCYIVGKHQNHTITSIEEKNKQVLEDIGKELPQARIVLKNLHKIDRKIVSAMPNVKIETKSLIENINHSFLRLHSLIQAREMEIIKEVYSAYKDHLISVEQQRETMEKVRNELEDAIRKSNKLFENNALVLDGQALFETLRKARTIPCIAVKTEVSGGEQMQWHESHDENLTDIINIYGSISGAPTQKLVFKTIEEASDYLEDDDKMSIISLGSEYSTLSMGAIVSVPENTSSVDAAEDVAVESEDIDASEINKGNSNTAQEHIILPVIKGPAQKVVVTHICSPNDFCVQLQCNKRQLDTLSHNMNSWCHRNASSKHIPVLVEKDMMLLGRYSADKQWYRVQVLNVDKPHGDKDDSYKVHVKYIDFGNEEYLPLKELRTMQKRFMKYPVFSVQCSLFDIAPFDEDEPWSLESVQEFHKMTQNQVIMMSALSVQGAVYEVDLMCMPMVDALDDNYVAVRDILILLELARFRTFSDASKNTSAPPSYPKIDYIKPTAVKNGKVEDVIVTQVTSPWDLHLVCTGEEHEYYLTMHDEMQDMYNKDLFNIYSLFYPRAGMVCAAKGSDGEWHRAKVASSPMHRQVTVSFVDLGITQIVSYDNLKKLHSSFIKLPIQAIPCLLVDVCPINGSPGEWSDEAKLWCCTKLTGASGRARFIRNDQDTQVVLWLDSSTGDLGKHSINSALVEKGFAQSTGPSSIKSLERSQTSSGHVVFKNGGSHYRSHSKEAGDPFLVTNKPSKTSKSATTVAKSQQPRSAKSTLEKTQKISERSLSPDHKPKTSERNKSKAQNISNVQKSTEEKCRIQQEIHKAMSTDCSPATQESGTTYIEVVICNYVSPSEFYVQVLETQEDLMKLMKDMQATFGNSQPTPSCNWTVKEYCAAKYSSDGLWYRGNIMSKVSDEEYEVEYVDFGNVDIVNVCNLRPLSQEFGSRIPCAAARCHLANLLPAGSMDITKWSQTAIEFMASLLKDRKLYIKQEGDPTEIGLPVDLIMEEEIPETAFEPRIQSYHSVRRAVIKNGLAMPSKKESIPSSPELGINPFQRFIYMDENSSEGMQHQMEGDESSVNKILSPVDLESDLTTKAVKEEVEQTFEIVPKKMEPYQVATLSLPPYPLPELGVEVTVVPTYVDMEGIIYAQPIAWEGKCAHISSELQRIYGHISYVGKIEWKVGQMCVAQFPDDGLWYRAKIQVIRDDKVKVHYTDFGNFAWVKASELREMLPAFAEEHALACCYVLYDLEPISPKRTWPIEVLDYIHKLIINNACTIVPVEADEDTPIKIQLLKEDLNLCEELIKRNLAVSPSSIKRLCEQSYLIGQVLANQNPYHLFDIGDEGDTFRAIMIHVEFPNVIYLQRGLEDEPDSTDFVRASEVAEINNSIKEFVEMAERLKSCKSMPLSQLPDVGLMCAALFTADNQLYRALCVQRFPETDSCLVVYVDYGTSEVIPRKRLRLLPSEFWSIPAQAIRCCVSVSSVTEPVRQLTHHLLVGIINSLEDQELMAKILKKNPLTVELMIEEGGKWRVPYKHLFEDQLQKPPKLGICMKDQKAEATKDADRISHDMKGEQSCRENWNGDSDDDSMRTCEEGENEAVRRGEAADAESTVSTSENMVSSAVTTTLQAEKFHKKILDGDVSSDDDDDVDWVIDAARLMENEVASQRAKETSQAEDSSDETDVI